jgi:hypothetical protein
MTGGWEFPLNVSAIGTLVVAVHKPVAILSIRSAEAVPIIIIDKALR